MDTTLTNERDGGQARATVQRFAAIAGPVVCALQQGIAEGAAHAVGGTVARFDTADPTVRPRELTLDPANEGSP